MHVMQSSIPFPNGVNHRWPVWPFNEHVEQIIQFIHHLFSKKAHHIKITVWKTLWQYWNTWACYESHTLVPSSHSVSSSPRISWWRHQKGTFSASLAICAENSPVPGKFPAQRPVTRSFDVFFDLRLNKWLNKQSWAWWFEMLSCPLWRHCNVMVLHHQ